MTPVACMITDRVDRVRHAADGGVDLVQVRAPALDARALFALVRACLDALRGTRARLVVNDRLDIALAAGAHGVHLRGDSFSAVRARTITPPGFLIGRSVHGADETRDVTAEGGLDYLIFGPVFETASKPGKAAAGLGALSLVTAATPLPVLAVGGIRRDRIAGVIEAGASGYAAIGMFAGSESG